MNTYRKTLLLLGLIIIGAVTLSSCDDDFTEIPNDDQVVTPPSPPPVENTVLTPEQRDSVLNLVFSAGNPNIYLNIDNGVTFDTLFYTVNSQEEFDEYIQFEFQDNIKPNLGDDFFEENTIVWGRIYLPFDTILYTELSQNVIENVREYRVFIGSKIQYTVNCYRFFWSVHPKVEEELNLVVTTKE